MWTEEEVVGCADGAGGGGSCAMQTGCDAGDTDGLVIDVTGGAGGEAL